MDRVPDRHHAGAVFVRIRRPLRDVNRERIVELVVVSNDGEQDVPRVLTDTGDAERDDSVLAYLSLDRAILVSVHSRHDLAFDFHDRGAEQVAMREAVQVVELLFLVILDGHRLPLGGDGRDRLDDDIGRGGRRGAGGFGVRLTAASGQGQRGCQRGHGDYSVASDMIEHVGPYLMN